MTVRCDPGMVIAAVALCLCVGCGTRSSLDHAVRQYVELAIALGEHDPNALDYYYGPPDWAAGIRAHPHSLSQIKTEASELMRSLAQPPQSEEQAARRRFLIGQLQAIVARSDLLLGVSHSFDREAELFFGIHLASVTLPDFTPVRTQLERLLPGKGDLAGRYAAFDQKYLIPRQRVPALIERALQACRARTLAHWTLPAGETVAVEYVHDKPWSAYSTYQGNYHSTIRVNIDLGLTVDRALDLACHEGYPGHHAFNSLTEQQSVRKSKRLEFSVQPTFSPQSLVSEAAATAAPALAFSRTERIRFEREVLFPLAGLNPDNAERYMRVQELVDSLHPAELAIARDYLDGRLEFARAATALRDIALMTYSDATLRYLNEYRTYVLTYTEGGDRMRQWLKRYVAAPSVFDRRWDAVRRLASSSEDFADHWPAQ